MNKSGRIKLLLVFMLLLPPFMARAQGEAPSGPVYVVQYGDTFWDIAVRFQISLDELQQANPAVNPGQIQVGNQLVIPGLDGISGTLVTMEVGYGETLRSLSRRYRVPVEMLARLNHLTSPYQLYSGTSLILIEGAAQAEGGSQRISLQAGQSLLELALLTGSSPWAFAERNDLSSPLAALPGDILRTPYGASVEDAGPGALPEQVQSIQLDPQTLVQGKTTVVRVTSSQPLTLSGSLAGDSLDFFEESPNSYVALQGLHAMIEPGGYELSLSGSNESGKTFDFSQLVLVTDGEYVYEALTVEEITLDPTVNQPENEQWQALITPVTPEKYWEGVFTFPSEAVFYDCWPSTFGRRRSYNQSDYTYFHTGLDVCGGVGTEIYAPGAGEVIFTGLLMVRGNATLINHGWGIYTGYMHQSEILVNVGDRVEPGQLIGLVGATGRVTGPHLHWEVWAGGVQIDPMDWLERAYP